jgi:hypothetical protein
MRLLSISRWNIRNLFNIKNIFKDNTTFNHRLSKWYKKRPGLRDQFNAYIREELLMTSFEEWIEYEDSSSKNKRRARSTN